MMDMLFTAGADSFCFFMGAANESKPSYDWLGIAVIPILLALLGAFWPEIQRCWKRRHMEKLILRELSEASPFPSIKDINEGKEEALESWDQHMQKRFVHCAILSAPDEHADLLLSLDPDMVYYVSMLWNNLNPTGWRNWQHALENLSRSYDHRLARLWRRWAKEPHSKNDPTRQKQIENHQLEHVLAEWISIKKYYDSVTSGGTKTPILPESLGDASSRITKPIDGTADPSLKPEASSHPQGHGDEVGGG